LQQPCLLIGGVIGHNLKANTTWYIAQIISIFKPILRNNYQAKKNLSRIGTRFLLISVQRVNNHSFTKLVFALKYLGTWIF
jgi:hypothetical protein